MTLSILMSKVLICRALGTEMLLIPKTMAKARWAHPHSPGHGRPQALLDGEKVGTNLKADSRRKLVKCKIVMKIALPQA